MAERKSFAPKAICTSEYKYVRMEREEDFYWIIYDEINKEIIDLDFIKKYFELEFEDDNEDAPERKVKLFGKTSIQIKPRYYPLKRYGTYGPIMTYEGYEIEGQFIKIDAFLHLFDMLDDI